MASTPFNNFGAYKLYQQAAPTGFSSAGYVKEERIGNVVILDFYLKPTSTLPASGGWQKICDLQNTAKSTHMFTVQGVGSAQNICFQISGKTLNWYTSYTSGWLNTMDMRGQIMFIAS